jgi:ABC-type phosphate/phosphonate transport system substrate-binding protein
MSISPRHPRPQDKPTDHRSSFVPAAVPMVLLVMWIATLHFRNQERLLSAALAIGPDDQAGTVETTTTAPAVVARPLVGLTVGPADAPTTEAAQQFFTWLAQASGSTPGDAITRPTDDDALTALTTGHAQIALLSPEAYVRAKALMPDLDLLGTEIRWDDARTKLVDATTIYLVSLKSRHDLTTLSPTGTDPDAHRLRVAFTSRDSLCGYRYPAALLAGAGLTTGTFDESFTPDPAGALTSGATDLAALTDTAFHKAIARSGDVFRVLKQSAPLPNRCVVATGSVPVDVRAKLAALLVAIDPQRVTGLGAHGFVRRPDAFYDATRQLLDATTD